MRTEQNQNRKAKIEANRPTNKQAGDKTKQHTSNKEIKKTRQEFC